MKEVRHNIARDKRQLGLLAMQFRGTRDKVERDTIAQEYAQTVERLVQSGKWKDMPAPEDQLPDDCMPPVFFKYWLE
jgi:hypothetical protein